MKHKTLAVIGAQWGDEGKGKIVDLLAKDFDYTVRFQGGNNAGHTIVHNNKTIKLHLLPSGVMHKNITVMIGAGVVINPETLFQEINSLKKYNLNPKIKIDYRSHIILPTHILIDSASEAKLSRANLSALSTKRGIWPVYSDKTARIGIRAIDLTNKNILEKKINIIYTRHKNTLKHLFKTTMSLSKKEIIQKLLKNGKKIKPYLDDVSVVLNKAYNNNKKIIFEGAQGIMLDIDWGLYPYTTSSNTSVNAVGSGAGFPAKNIDSCVGVVKAYLSRVGGGYLPTELENSLGDEIREKGAEYGTTTGRPRRIGWLDLVQLKTAVRLNSFTSLAITKIDVLDGLPEIKVCTSYKYKNKILKEIPADIEIYEKCQPIYKTFKGWEGSYTKNGKYKNLPVNMRLFIEYISKSLQTPIHIISTGPDREHAVFKN